MEDKIIAVIEVENFEECNRFLKLEDCVLIQAYTKHVIKHSHMSQQIVYVLGIKSLETMAVINKLQEKKLLIEFNDEKGFELTVEGLNIIDMSIAIHALINELAEMTNSDAMYVFGAMIQTHEKFNESINKTNKEVKHV